jgi:hypothetical protein
MTKIIFTNTLGTPEEFAPKPASTCVPSWYKDIPSYMNGIKKPDGQGGTSATIKRCMPVFDSISAGYILFTPVDVWISQRDGEPWYEWPSFGPIQFHPVKQAPTHPDRNGHQTDYPKWINSWATQTPSGYSTLFVQPFHRESVFTILPGVVDTDQYNAPVNFPFVLNNIKYEGLIPAGTPMAQVIPFKRDLWQMEIGNSNDFNEQNKTTIKLRSKFFDGYKTLFRQNKEYK